MIGIIISAILGGIIWFIYHKLTYWQRQGVPTPGLIYQIYYYLKELGPYDLELVKKHGSVYGTYEGLKPNLIVSDPDLAREILVKDFPIFPNHKIFRLGIPIVDLNMFSLDGGEDWKRIRSIVSPTFTSGKLRGMDGIVYQAINQLKDHMKQAAKDGTAINVRKYFNSLSMDVVVRCAYGSKVDLLSNPENEFNKNLEQLFSGRFAFFFTLYFPTLAKTLGVTEMAMGPFRFFEELSQQLLDQRLATGESNNDFLQLMLDANKEAKKEGASAEAAKKTISESEMMAQSLIFLIAGFDTTATILACSAYHLAKHPDVQEKLILEVSTLSEINHDSVNGLKYLEAVLKECFRLSPPIIRVERECVAETKIGNALVKPGTVVSIPVFALQRDPKQFSEPDIFNPNRFLEGGADVNHHPYAYLPFGGGPRMCIAQRFALMEAKMALVSVLQTFRFKPTLETKLEYSPASFDVLAPKGIMLRIEEHETTKRQ